MGNKLGRTRIYEFNFPERLINLMSKGYLDAQIYKRLNISHDTFTIWKKDHPEFSEAYKIGLEYRKSYYFDIAKEYLEGNRPKVREGMLKKFLETLAEEFKETEKRTNNSITQVNIQAIQVLNRLDRPQLLQRVTDLLKRNNVTEVMDVNPIESTYSAREIDADDGRRIEGVDTNSSNS